LLKVGRIFVEETDNLELGNEVARSDQFIGVLLVSTFSSTIHGHFINSMLLQIQFFNLVYTKHVHELPINYVYLSHLHYRFYQ